MNLEQLAVPFPAQDVEWRISRSGRSNGSVFCYVLAYITARAIAQRLDEVCGPGNWCNTPMQVDKITEKIVSIQVGISIRINGEWVTKYDVSEPTNIEAVKGGFSGAMKRAGAQWGIGRYLYYLDETRAEVSEDGKGPGWTFAKAKDGGVFFWKPKPLPAWALPSPKEQEDPVKLSDIIELKKRWKTKFAAKTTNRIDLADGFSRFVFEKVGSFPIDDVACWTQNILSQVQAKLDAGEGGSGPDGDVPFAGTK